MLMLVLVLMLLVALVGQCRRGNLLLGPYGILEGEEVESRSSSVVGIVRLISVGVIRTAVGFVTDIVVLRVDVLSIGLRIEGWSSGANAKRAIEYTIECIEGVRGDGSGVGGGLARRSAVYDGEEGSGVGSRRWEGATTSNKWSETGSGNIWSEASSDKGTVESPKAQRSLIGGTGKHGGGEGTSTKGVAHRPT